MPALMTNDGSEANLRRPKTPSKHNDARVLSCNKYYRITAHLCLDSRGNIKAGGRDKSIHYNWMSFRTLG